MVTNLGRDQKNSLAVVIQVIDERHLSGGWCANFGTGGCGDVETAVRIARLAIEESAMTKQAAHPDPQGVAENRFGAVLCQKTPSTSRAADCSLA